MKKGIQKKLGEILIEESLIEDNQLAIALGQQRQTGKGKLGSELIRLGFIKEEDLASVLERQLGIMWLSLRDVTIASDATRILKADVAERFFVMPVTFKRKALVVATIDPTDLQMLDTLSFAINMPVEPVIATESDIKWALHEYYNLDTDTVGNKEEIGSVPYEPSTVAMEKADADLISEKQNRYVTADEFENLISLLAEKGILSKLDIMKKIYSDEQRKSLFDH